MIQISYVSQSSEPMSSGKLLDLLLECRENNEKKGVTGMLLYSNDTFLQVLEGDDQVVDKLVETIIDDPRHEKVKLLKRKEIDQRDYGEWSMGFEQVTDGEIKGVEGLANFGPDDFTFEYLTGHGPVVDKLLQHYREPHWEQVIGELDAKDRVIEHLEEALGNVRDQARIACLALESVTESARKGETNEAVLKICEATLASMRKNQSRQSS